MYIGHWTFSKKYNVIVTFVTLRFTFGIFENTEEKKKERQLYSMVARSF